MSNILNEAFKAMRLMESEDFDLSSINDESDINAFIDDEDNFDDVEVEVVDADANTEDDIRDSYVGKVICQCPVCKGLTYKSPDELNVDDETGLVDVGVECPTCFSDTGLEIIGEVEEFSEEETSDDTTSEDEPIEDSTDESEEEDSIEEGIGGALAGAAVGKAVGHPIIGALAGNAIGNIAGNVASNVITDKILNRDKKEALEPKSKHLCDEQLDEVLPLLAPLAAGAATGLASAVTNKVASDLMNNEAVEDEQDGEQLDEAIPVVAIKAGAKFIAAHWKEILAGLEAVGVAADTIREIAAKLKENNVVTEDLDSATIETDSDIINIEPEGDSITISASGKDDEEADDGDEVIAPLSDDTQAEIEDSAEDNTETAVPSEDDIDDFDEESFDAQTESYLKKKFENVNSYKTSSVASSKGKLMIEGVISFKSGKNGKASFVVENVNGTKSAAVLRVKNENANLDFAVRGKLAKGKFTTESLNESIHSKVSGKKLTESFHKPTNLHLSEELYKGDFSPEAWAKIQEFNEAHEGLAELILDGFGLDDLMDSEPDDWTVIDANDDEALGYAIVDEFGEPSEEAKRTYFDYEAFGRDYRLEGSGTFIDGVFVERI